MKKLCLLLHPKIFVHGPEIWNRCPGLSLVPAHGKLCRVVRVFKSNFTYSTALFWSFHIAKIFHFHFWLIGTSLQRSLFVTDNYGSTFSLPQMGRLYVVMSLQLRWSSTAFRLSLHFYKWMDCLVPFIKVKNSVWMVFFEWAHDALLLTLKELHFRRRARFT